MSAATRAGTSAPALDPADLARDMAKNVFGDNIRLWQFYYARTRRGPARTSWQRGVERSKEEWAVRMGWGRPGHKSVARWRIELPLADLVVNPPGDIELDDKVLADNRLAERLSTIPKVRPRNGHKFGLFVSVGDASSDGRNLRLLVATVADEIPNRYIKMGDSGVALLRGSTWLASHHVDGTPRYILLDRHTRIEVRDKPGAHSFGWFVTQLRKHPIEAAAVWSTPPASVSRLGTDIVQRLVIDPDFQEVG